MASPEKPQIEKGSIVWRRGIPCRIINVDYALEPPSLVVRLPDGRTISTEVSRISVNPPSIIQIENEVVLIISLETVILFQLRAGEIPLTNDELQPISVIGPKACFLLFLN
jgi:hypothetical protein